MKDKCGFCQSTNLDADYADLGEFGEQRVSEWDCLDCGAIQFEGEWHKIVPKTKEEMFNAES